MKTRFVCENCGKDVPFNAEVCPFCGRMFSGVKCPVCKTSGRPEEFKNGCPSCGYLSPKMNNLLNTETINHKKPNPKKSKKNKSTSLYLLLYLLFIMMIAIFIILIIKGNL